MKRFPQVVTIALVFSLGGCADSDLEELQMRMEAMQSEAQGEVAPLPTLQEPEPPAFLADGRNPMTPPEALRAGGGRTNTGPRPEPEREPDPLEAFSLGSLRLVGLMGSDQRRIALIEGPEGHMYSVAPGDYMGRNHGRVERITAEAIELRELVEAGNGWEERTSTVARDDQEH